LSFHFEEPFNGLLLVGTSIEEVSSPSIEELDRHRGSEKYGQLSRDHGLVLGRDLSDSRLIDVQV
jgi:hypothetical protein